jgi:hypothetical protein
MVGVEYCVYITITRELDVQMNPKFDVPSLMIFCPSVVSEQLFFRCMIFVPPANANTESDSESSGDEYISSDSELDI